MANNRLLAGIATTGSLNGTVITFKFTATGADARYVTVVTQVVIIVWGRASNRPVGRLRSNPEAPLARKLAKSTREEPGGIID